MRKSRQVAEKNRIAPVRAASDGSVTATGRSSTRRGVGESVAVRHAQEVVPVQGAAEALSVQHGIAAHGVGNVAVRVDVGEMELAALRQQPAHAPEHRVLVGAEIQHAVRDDDVESVLRPSERVETLDVAVDEADVVGAERVAVPRAVRLGRGATWPP
jgi:hypothetical protein